MKRTLPVLVLVAAALAPRAASAQVSLWLQRGVSGFGAALTLATNSDQTTYGVTGGYSYEGYLELDLSLSYANPTVMGASLSEYVLAPQIQYHPIKQTADVPVSVGLSAGFQKLFVTSSAFLPGAGISGLGAGAGVSVYRFVKLTANVGVIPAASLGYVHTWTTITNSAGTDTTFGNDSGALGLGAYLAYIDDAGRIWGLVPSVTFGFGDVKETTFGLELGLVISQQ
jgi:hypothetical protein